MVGGDGIGPEVVAEAVDVLDRAGFEGSFVEAAAGWTHWLETGEAIADQTLDLVATHGLCLFGATTSQPAAVADALAAQRRLPPWSSPILTLRRKLDLDVSYRPIRSFPGNPGNALIRSEGRVIEPDADMVVVRQNTEGLYVGVEWRQLPDQVLTVLASHPNWPDTGEESPAVSVRVVTRRSAERTAEAGFALAKARGEHEVVVAEKANILRATSGLFVEAAEEVSERYPGIELVSMNADAAVMEMVACPRRFGVIVTSNLFGDLISDAAAGLVGGPGFVPSSNVGDTAAVFEPAHGSAPTIAGSGTANPVAAILAGAMLADHVGQTDVADRIRSSVAEAIAAGLPASTSAIGQAVRAVLTP